jgi:aminoglycoside N3'-acetyltransferase
MGILSKIAIKSKRGLRSECPMFSYYIIGQNKEKYISRQSVQCFGKETLFHTLFEEKTIFLGIGINYSNGMTPFMHIEKNAAVPFRYNLRLEGNIIDAISRKKRSATAIHFARNEESYKHIITNSREKLGEAMEKNGISRAIRFNKSKIYALESSSFYDYIFDQLTNNPFCMTEPSNEY